MSCSMSDEDCVMTNPVCPNELDGVGDRSTEGSTSDSNVLIEKKHRVYQNESCNKTEKIERCQGDVGVVDGSNNQVIGTVEVIVQDNMAVDENVDRVIGGSLDVGCVNGLEECVEYLIGTGGVEVKTERASETEQDVGETSKAGVNDKCKQNKSDSNTAMNVEVEPSSALEKSPESIFRRPKRKLSNRVFRSRMSDGNSSIDEDEEEREEGEPKSTTGTQSRSNMGDWEGYSLSSSSSSSSSSSPVSIRSTPCAELLDDDDDKLPRVLAKPKPRHKWFIVQEVIDRQIGVASKYLGPNLFQQRCYGSLHCVQRLELMYKLEAHNGCVNTLNFNSCGSLLATASDDRSVALWDWALGKCVFTYDSGHSSNVFQAKFLPLSGDRHIVSCARDGQVRLAVLSGFNVCRSTRQLAVHRRPAHKIATQPETPHVFLSSGEDAVVYSLDVRDYNNKKLLTCKDGPNRIALYSIQSNPINCHEFCVTGENKYIRLYDKRKISPASGPLRKFCPQHLVKSQSLVNVTCAVFNYNGTELLGSFNDEDIYLFDTRHSENADYVHRYEGHRNSVTVKGVNFFGPRSEYIVSGSDCGNIFFWDKDTESIVQWMRGDEEGVVNCLEPHPQLPMIATSGLDYDIKIWVPSCEQEPTFSGLKSAVTFNQRARDENKNQTGDAWDSQMQWIWRQIRRFERRRDISPESRPETRAPAEADAAGQGESEASSPSSSSTSDEEENVRSECAPS